MSISERELLQLYGEAATAGNAALFIGAGLSLSAGFPTWNDLLDSPRKQVNIPDTLDDLPLLAQYYVQNTAGGRDELESHILNVCSRADTGLTDGHRWLGHLPVDDIWTTNYDCLVEMAIPGLGIVADDSDLQERRRLPRRRVMKMHGSFTMDTPPKWRNPPVITRQDYEEYEARHPRLWAALRATYLTKSMLFLGFSFTDPNTDLLLRLSRTLLSPGAPEHFTVLRRPDDPVASRLHDLLVKDLEASGLAVCEVESFDQLEPILGKLVRRTRRKLLFISGSGTDNAEALECGSRLGVSLAPHGIDFASLAGTVAMRTSYSFGEAMMAETRYSPERIRFFFLHKAGRPPPLDERIGTAIYTGFDDIDELREHVLFQCRAAVVMGGSETTKQEIMAARQMALPVIPIARSGGAARELWEELGMEGAGIIEGREAEMRNWQLLAHENIDIAVGAATRLIRRSMYVDQPSDSISSSVA